MIALDAKMQFFDSGRRQRGGLTFKEPHPRRRGRKISTPVEIIGRCRGGIEICRRVQIGIAMLDSRSFRHAAEEHRIAFISFQKCMTKLQESLMHIEGRHSGRDPIDMGFSQSRLFSWRMKRPCDVMKRSLQLVQRERRPPWLPAASQQAGTDRHR